MGSEITVERAHTLDQLVGQLCCTSVPPYSHCLVVGAGSNVAVIRRLGSHWDVQSRLSEGSQHRHKYQNWICLWNLGLGTSDFVLSTIHYVCYVYIYIILYYIILYYTILYYIILYYTILYYIILNYIVLYYIISYYNIINHIP